MDVIKGLLMGCGALAILSFVGCVGMVGVGSYAVDQAIEAQRLEDEANRSAWQGQSGEPSSDPFSDYSGDSDTASDGANTDD